MPTIGKKWPRSAPFGDYSALCDYCGIGWRRSDLCRDGAGLLACPDDQSGRDAVTLAELNSRDAARPRLFPRRTDGANFDDSGGPTEPAATHRTTAEDIEL